MTSARLFLTGFGCQKCVQKVLQVSEAIAPFVCLRQCANTISRSQRMMICVPSHDDCDGHGDGDDVMMVLRMIEP